MRGPSNNALLSLDQEEHFCDLGVLNKFVDLNVLLHLQKRRSRVCSIMNAKIFLSVALLMFRIGVIQATVQCPTAVQDRSQTLEQDEASFER